MTSTGFGLEMTRRAVADTLRPVADFIYPPRCPACGAGIGAQTGLCLDCWNALETPGEECRGRTAHEIIAAARYCDLSRKLILAFKHGGRIALAPMLARLIATSLGEPQPERLIVPVPLHPFRLWRRGYNQSALLARELARLGHGRLLIDGLQRTKSTPSLDRRSGSERAALLVGAIRPHPRRAGQLHEADILLVDDVLTSGATSGACVAALKQAGARKVTVACFARVTSRSGARRNPASSEMAPAAHPETNARDHAIPGVA